MILNVYFHLFNTKILFEHLVLSLKNHFGICVLHHNYNYNFLDHCVLLNITLITIHVTIELLHSSILKSDSFLSFYFFFKQRFLGRLFKRLLFFKYLILYTSMAHIVSVFTSTLLKWKFFWRVQWNEGHMKDKDRVRDFPCTKFSVCLLMYYFLVDNTYIYLWYYTACFDICTHWGITVLQLEYVL